MFYVIAIFLFLSGSLIAQDTISLPFPLNSAKTSAKDSKKQPSRQTSNLKTATEDNGSEKSKSSDASIQNSTSADSSSRLPNISDLKKPTNTNGNTGRSAADESHPPFQRARYYLNRVKIKNAKKQLDESIQKKGESSFSASLDKIRLLGLERKAQKAKAIIDQIKEPQQKYKALFELAMALVTSAKTKQESDEAIPFYLKIVTEAPKDARVLPRTLWALGNLHFRMNEYIPALDYLSLLILQHKESGYIDDAYYLSGRIYQAGDETVKNQEKAKLYYHQFLDRVKKREKFFVDSIYINEVKERIQHL